MSVMNVKRGAQTFSKAEQTSALKNDNARTVSATDHQEAFGDQNVGDVLNKVADPNWVDPMKKPRAVGNNQLDKDAFLKLMLAQMKHQDPTNPMQSHEMAAQLAQFTSLEQLNNINMTLNNMQKSQEPQTNYQALALIGKRISGDSSKLARAAGDTKHGISFELLGDAANVKITIKDAAGNPVRKLDVGALKKGANSIEWNGLSDDGMSSRPGEYRVAVEGVNSSGGKIFAKTEFSGRITGLNYTNEGPVLLVGNQSVKLSDVKKIEEVPADEQGAAKAVPLKSGAAAPNALQNALPSRMMNLEGSSSSAQTGQAAQAGPRSLTPAVKPEAKSLTRAQAKAAGANPGASSNANAPNKIVADDNVQPAEDSTVPNNIDSVPMSNALLSQLARER